MKYILYSLILLTLLLPLGGVSADGYLKDFESVEILRGFIQQDNTNEFVRLVADNNGTINFDNQCEESALQLIQRAEAKGYRLNFQVINVRDYARWRYLLPKGQLAWDDGHAVCSAIVGNDIYFIEPQNDNVWFAYHLD